MGEGAAGVKTYQHCYCDKTHRSYATKAKCLWKRAYWITGDGPYAVLAWCRVLTVTLHNTADDAQAAKRWIDETACGGRCHRSHEIIRINF